MAATTLRECGRGTCPNKVAAPDQFCATCYPDQRRHLEELLKQGRERLAKYPPSRAEADEHKNPRVFCWHNFNGWVGCNRGVKCVYNHSVKVFMRIRRLKKCSQCPEYCKEWQKLCMWCWDAKATTISQSQTSNMASSSAAKKEVEEEAPHQHHGCCANRECYRHGTWFAVRGVTKCPECTKERAEKQAAKLKLGAPSAPAPEKHADAGATATAAVGAAAKPPSSAS